MLIVKRADFGVQGISTGHGLVRLLLAVGPR
jgi:hypothetical protein